MGYLFLRDGRAQMRGTYSDLCRTSVLKAWLENMQKSEKLSLQARDQRVVGSDREPFQALRLLGCPKWFGGSAGSYVIVNATTPEVIHASTPDDQPVFVIPNVYVASEGPPEATGVCSSEQIRTHLQQLTVPPSTFYGKPVICSENHKPWPLSYRLRSTSEIAAALVGETSWVHSSVMMELQLLFQGDLHVARKRIETCRVDLLRQAMQLIRT